MADSLRYTSGGVNSGGGSRVSAVNSNSQISSSGATASGKFAVGINDSFRLSENAFEIFSCLLALAFAHGLYRYRYPEQSSFTSVWNLSSIESNGYVGSAMNSDFYASGILFSILFGCLSGVVTNHRQQLFVFLFSMLGVAIVWEDIPWAHSVASMSLGGMLPVVYSMVGEWFPASYHPVGVGSVAAAVGGGSALGQILSTMFVNVDLRHQYLIFFLPWPLLFMRSPPSPLASFKNINVSGNLIILLQAFPGNLPWYILAEYLRNMCIGRLRLRWDETTGVMGILAASGFAGLILGSFISYRNLLNPQIILLLSIIRSFPLFFVFDLQVTSQTRHTLLALLFLSGVLENATIPGIGAWVMQKNSHHTRGLVFAIYSFLDDLARATASYMVAELLPQPNDGQSVIFQVSVAVWIISLRSIFLLPRKTKPPPIVVNDGEEDLTKNYADKPPLPEKITPVSPAPPIIMMAPPNMMMMGAPQPQPSSYDYSNNPYHMGMQYQYPPFAQYHQQQYQPPSPAPPSLSPSSARRFPVSSPSPALNNNSSTPRWSERKRQLPSPKSTPKENNSAESLGRLILANDVMLQEDAAAIASSIKSDNNPSQDNLQAVPPNPAENNSHPSQPDKVIPNAFSAARHNQYEIVENMLQEFPSLVDATDPNNKGNSLLHIACSNGYARITKLLVKLGANVDLANSEGNTPLHLSYQYGRNALVSILIAANANENARNHNDQIPSQMFKPYVH